MKKMPACVSKWDGILPRGRLWIIPKRAAKDHAPDYIFDRAVNNLLIILNMEAPLHFVNQIRKYVCITIYIYGHIYIYIYLCMFIIIYGLKYLYIFIIFVAPRLFNDQ